MQPLTTDDFKRALNERGLEINVTLFTESTATSQQAADQIGCALGQIVKSLAFMVDGSPVLILASGDGMVDNKKISAMFNVGRKKVKVAKPDEVIAIWGYAPGGVPPFGHRTSDFPIYMDESLKRFEMVYAAGGAHNAIFGIEREQLAEITGATYADVRKDAS